FVLREVEKAEKILRDLFNFYIEHEELISSSWTRDEDPIYVKVTDYISGMTDRYAIKKFTELFIPKEWGGVE
ncbi:MAG: deoxyguanosinetriphosphate triphosphohydrolase, partial [candidate division WOR-3 bacterium]